VTITDALAEASVDDLSAAELRVRDEGPILRPADVWQRDYRRLLVTVDIVAIVFSTLTGLLIRFGGSGDHDSGHNYLALALVLVPLWVTALVWRRAYDMRYLGTGAEEFKRVAGASLQLMAAVGLVSYIGKLQLARGYVAFAFPIGTAMLLTGRYAARRWLHTRRAEGSCQHQVIAVGSPESIVDLSRQFARESAAGFSLRGACVPREVVGVAGHVNGVPVLGSFDDVISAVHATRADTVAVVPGPGLSPEALRTMAWRLEGLCVDLVVAPALTEVAGPRINIRPVAGLPLLHVEEPELGGIRQLLKSAIDRCTALVLALLLLPLMGALMIAIRIDSRGPALFRQTRVGKHGRRFTVVKLRSMYLDAESQLDAIRGLSDANNTLLFKIRQDPRVTRVGRFLRKWSIDELPQLWNVVRGDMALVGPRPPLPSEVDQAGSDFARRLLVRPGITGLWQVSGRSDLSLEDSVRLDLYYVENWSLALDAMITCKTLTAILQRKGAY
jgi:exopolysaccharide biosynthesis polyprenyl glycosylphosphotransferase